MEAYRGALTKILQLAAVPYGLALSTWGSGAAVQHFRGTPKLWEVFLFAVGGMGGYMLATLPLTRALRETKTTQPDQRMALSGTLHLLAVGAAIGAAALVGKVPGWTAWPLGGLCGILVYLLLAALEALIAPRLPHVAEEDRAGS